VARATFNRRIVVGTPVTPVRLLDTHEGGSFCVSFARPDQIERCIKLVGDDQILVLDNGAFTMWMTERKGKQLPPRLRFESQEEYREAFWSWANAIQERCPVAVAVIPDVIEGSEHDNLMELSWALREDMAAHPDRTMAIWHLNESLEQLEKMCRLMNFVGFGSCAEYDVQKHRDEYDRRVQEAMAVVDRVEREHNRRPWIHLMRGLGRLQHHVACESADSTNAAVNHHRYKESHGDMRSKFVADRTSADVHDAIAAGDVVEVTSTISNFYDAPTRRPA